MCFCLPNLSPHSYLDSDFSKWVALHLLRVAAAPDCEVIHVRVSAVLCSLLHTLRARAPFIYSRLTQDFIFLAQELSNILATHIATLVGSQNILVNSQSQWPVTLQCFSISPVCTSSYLSPCPLVLSSPAALESLTVVVIVVVTDTLRGIVSRHDVSVAWETACSFLAYGNKKLQKISMIMLRRLVELGGFPERQSYEFFTAYLQLLETHLYTNTANTDVDENHSYEGELLNLTRCVFSLSDAGHLHFEHIYLSQMFECICAIGGAGVKFGRELAESLCLLFNYLLSDGVVYEGAALLRRQRLTEVCRMLVCTVGTENQAEVRFFSSCMFLKNLPLPNLITAFLPHFFSVCRGVSSSCTEGRGYSSVAKFKRWRGCFQKILQTCLEF